MHSSSRFVKAILEGQTDLDLANILWDAFNSMNYRFTEWIFDFNGWIYVVWVLVKLVANSVILSVRKLQRWDFFWLWWDLAEVLSTWSSWICTVGLVSSCRNRYELMSFCCCRSWSLYFSLVAVVVVLVLDIALCS